MMMKKNLGTRETKKRIKDLEIYSRKKIIRDSFVDVCVWGEDVCLLVFFLSFYDKELIDVWMIGIFTNEFRSYEMKKKLRNMCPFCM